MSKWIVVGIAFAAAVVVMAAALGNLGSPVPPSPPKETPPQKPGKNDSEFLSQASRTIAVWRVRDPDNGVICYVADKHEVGTISCVLVKP